MGSNNLFVPLEVITTIGSFADTRTLSVLTRTTRALHTLLNPMLEKIFTASLERIATMAMINHRSVTLSRVMAAALNAHDLVFPGSEDPRTRKDYIYEIVKIHLAHLIFLPVDEDNARILTLALAHGIRPVLQRHCIGDAPWEGFERMTAIEWLCYGIRHEEVELVRWLVEKVWPKLGSDVTVAGGQTLLDFARQRSEAVAEGVSGGEEGESEEVGGDVKVSRNPSALLNALVEEEKDYAYDRLVRKNGFPLAERRRPGRYRLLNDPNR